MDNTQDLIPAPVKAYGLTELGILYERHYLTVKKWLQKVPDLGERIGRSFNPAQVQKIFNHLGTPYIKNNQKK